MTRRIRAPAKINLRLRVHDREPSGFHRLDTLFCALELSDELTIEVGQGRHVTLELDGPDLGPADRNLAVLAARGFMEKARLERSVAIRLRKRIPAGGGLGGGSSDGAAVLRVLSRMFPDAVPPGDLREIAESLGSDVPFFLSGNPFAVGTGRGDVLQAAPILPGAAVLLVFPGFPIPTPDAYRWLDEDRDSGEEPQPSSEEQAPPPPGDWAAAARQAVNDFEGPVFRRHPQLRRMRDALGRTGADIALLSGSGSTLFGIFFDDDAAERAHADLRSREEGTGLLLTRTVPRWPGRIPGEAAF